MASVPGPGHLFIVRADIRKLACDGWLLPGDHEGTGSQWAEFGQGERPTDWGTNTAMRVCRVRAPFEGAPVPWLTKTGAANASVEWYLESVEQFVRAAKAVRVIKDRARPLLAVPRVGMGRGGAKGKSGELIKLLVERLGSLARTEEVDIAFVFIGRDVAYAAAQEARRRLEKRNDLAHKIWPDELAQVLAHAETLGVQERNGSGRELALFLGAGVSMGAGLLGWTDLLKELASDLLKLPLAEAKKFAENTDPLIAAEVLAKHAGEGAVAAKIQDVLEPTDRRPASGLGHALLASLPVNEAITTNYDTLFEQALVGAGSAPTILPYELPNPGQRWLLKLHGTLATKAAQKPDIVLSQESYLRFDTRRKALGSVVEAVLLTRHVLFVGFSLTDANFAKMADNVRRLGERDDDKKPKAAVQKLGTVLVIGTGKYLDALWPELDVIRMGQATVDDDKRALEIFLDRLGQAASTDLEYLLHEDFSDLLSPEERELTGKLHDLAASVEGDASLAGLGAWRPFRELMKTLGKRRKPTAHLR